MPFDKKYYNSIKKYIDSQIDKVPFLYKGSFEDWIVDVWIKLAADCEKDGDYEGAKAIKDSIMYFLNKHLDICDKIPVDAILRLQQ